MIDALDRSSRRSTASYARTLVASRGCRALMAHYGIGAMTAVMILAELGDARRFSSSRHAVRYAGTGHHRVPVRSAPRARASLPPRAPGAALGAVRGRPSPRAGAASPDHAYYQQAAERLGGNRACLSVARKLLKRSYHTLRELGEEALQPA